MEQFDEELFNEVTGGKMTFAQMLEKVVDIVADNKESIISS